MRLTTIRKDEDVRTLVRRVYKQASARVLDKAEKELLKANPELAEGRLKPGAVLVVPDVEGTNTVNERESGPEVIGALLQAAAAQLPGLREAVTPLAGQQEEEAKATLARANTPELKKLADRQPELRRSLDAVIETAKADAKQAATLRAAQEKGFAEVQKDLDELLALFGQEPPR